MTRSPLYLLTHDERCVYKSTTKSQRGRSQRQAEVTPCVSVWDTNLKVMGPAMSNIPRSALLRAICLRNQVLSLHL